MLRLSHARFQTLFSSVRAFMGNQLKQIYLYSGVLTTSCMAASVVAFSMACFHGSGKEVFAAGVQTQFEEGKTEYGLGADLLRERPENGPAGQKMDAEAFADGGMLDEWLSANRQAGLEETDGIAERKFAEEKFTAAEFAKGKTEEADETEKKGSTLIGDVLKQDTKARLESGQAVRDRVGQAQEEIRTQQAMEAARQAEEEAQRKEAEAKKAALRIPCSEEDYQVMLKIVQAEAGGCDSRGKILVANVIMNRVRSREFPDSITGVVYEKSQFSPVSNGSINQVKVTEDTIECVNRALGGEDYSQGALYFMNRGASYDGNVRWFDKTLSFLFSHGGHEFFK